MIIPATYPLRFAQKGTVMTDPRPPECRQYSVGPDGKVNGIALQYKELPNTKYQLVRCDFINEASAMGNTSAKFDVYDKDGLPIEEKVWLAWVWPELKDGKGLPGNPNHEHTIVNGFDAARGVIGPLAMYPGDFAGNPIGDQIGGIGLPNNRHVCFHFVWKERGAVTPLPPVDPGTGGGDSPDVLSALNALDVKVTKLASHLGLTL